MGNHNSNVKIGFEDMQNLLNTSLIINTLSNDHQSCLIKNTLSSSHEENKINSLIYNNNFNIKIIIYGINCCDIFPTTSKQLDILKYKPICKNI
jgi:hypothetical protein